MTRRARIWFLVLLTGVLVASLASVAQAFEVKTFVAVNCKFGHEQCASTETAGFLGTPYSFPAKPNQTESETQGFAQAGGRIPYGVTDFELKTTGAFPNLKPEGAAVNHVRVDVAPGLATAPAAVPTCSLAEFGEKEEPIAGTGLFLAPTCSTKSEIGTEQVTIYVKELEEALGFGDLPLAGKVYNLVQPHGLASYYGVALAFPKPLTEAKGLGATQFYLHSFVKGSVEWGKEAAGTNAGDYHDYFEVEVNPADPLISSRQVLYGRAPEGKEESTGTGDFITNATSCPGNTTTRLTLKNTAEETQQESYKTLVSLENCKSLLFEPSFALSSGSSLTDAPNQITTEVSLPNDPHANAQSQLKTAAIQLPEGMTLNPSAAHGLEACTPAQAHESSDGTFTSVFGVECPSGSELGTVALNVPTLPDGSFTGAMYLAGPEGGGPITDPPYDIYVVANSARYGISVRFKGEAIPDPITGQLTTVFNKNPEQPFTNLTLHFNRGALTSVANPLVCGTPTGSTNFTPVASEGVPAAGAAFGVPITGCASSVPFALSQGVEYENVTAGAHTSYAFNLARSDGQQYLSKVKTSLPLGVVGEIPTVTQCAEALANAGTCPATSKIGTATVQSGSGSAPFTNTGNVYLTEKYNGAPYGLSIVVPAVAGPFNLGNVVTRSTINIDQKTARVTAESTLPTIVKGIPLRLRSLNININRQGFALNPTNCAVQPEGTSTTLTSTLGAVQTPLNTPFQAEGCSSLGFKPTFAASTSGKPTKNTGASLVTKITMPGGNSNIKSVKVTLPKQLPSRGSTLKKACLEAVFKANPFSCSPESNVGTATVVTPTLPGKMKGPAYLVSRGGAAFPNLELVLEDQGVRVILEGNTDIKNGITTTTFASSPDVPVTSVEVNLPQGPHSALGNFGSLCAPSLVIPTTMVGQGGKTFKQNTKLTPTGCPVQVVGRKVSGNTAFLTIKTFSAGRISASGKGLKTVAKNLSGANNKASLKVSLTKGHRKPFTAKIRVGFLAKKKNTSPTSSTSIKVKFG
jgi:hypothetical protein